MKYSFKIFSLLALALSLVTLTGCEEDTSKGSSLKDFVGLQAFMNVELLEGETTDVEGRIYASNTSSEDRTFTLQIESSTVAEANYSIPTTVTIPAGSRVGVFPVTLKAVDIAAGPQSIRVGIVPQLGVNLASNPTLDSDNAVTTVVNSSLVITLSELCLQNKVAIQIFTDGYGTETSWELYDASLNIVASGGPYEDEPGSGEVRVVCLPDGAYTFVIYDAFGDGMNDGTNVGFYKVNKFDADGNEVLIGTGGEFGTEEIVEFTLP